MLDGIFQAMHLLVIIGLALLMFGPKKLPELGKGISEGIRGFKSAQTIQTTSFTTSSPYPDGTAGTGQNPAGLEAWGQVRLVSVVRSA